MLTRLIRWIVSIFFREVVIEGEEHLAGLTAAIITPNHPNALLDPMLLFFLSLPSPIRFVAKAPLFKIPLFGALLRHLGSIPVVRRLDAQGDVDYTAFFAACVDALAGGSCIVIFPEGRSLPQPMMAPLRTGAARLFFMAREQGVDAKVVPVGLNYEHGAVFRSSVLISIAPPIETAPLVAQYAVAPAQAVRQLTAAINDVLARHIFQAETFRDRELMLLLERLYTEENDRETWAERWDRLKAFEAGLVRLRDRCPARIEALRRTLARYERIARTFGIKGVASRTSQQSGRNLFLMLLGTLVAVVGVGLNYVPYKFIAWLVRLTRQDASMAATSKILFSLIVFPLAYAVQAWLLARWLGAPAAVVFLVLIVPLSYFTLLFAEWRDGFESKPSPLSSWFRGQPSARVLNKLDRLRRQIVSEVEALASLPERQ